MQRHAECVHIQLKQPLGAVGDCSQRQGAGPTDVAARAGRGGAGRVSGAAWVLSAYTAPALFT